MLPRGDEDRGPPDLPRGDEDRGPPDQGRMQRGSSSGKNKIPVSWIGLSNQSTENQEQTWPNNITNIGYAQILPYQVQGGEQGGSSSGKNKIPVARISLSNQSTENHEQTQPSNITDIDYAQILPYQVQGPMTQLLLQQQWSASQEDDIAKYTTQQK